MVPCWRRFRLFKFLDDQERADLAARVKECTFAAEKLLFHAGDPGGSMFVIQAGEVEIFLR